MQKLNQILKKICILKVKTLNTSNVEVKQIIVHSCTLNTSNVEVKLYLFLLLLRLNTCNVKVK
ncbi:hypothetical protein AL710_01935 [Clostridium botulinum]|nr:hypothetical protein AL710_01935 [Clostridium botulinum]